MSVMSPRTGGVSPSPLSTAEPTDAIAASAASAEPAGTRPRISSRWRDRQGATNTRLLDFHFTKKIPKKEPRKF